ncbi:MAG: F0F1 ATP synthase subunit epsilon [Lentilactobacillus diolivorans]|uniref:ATP synthase epsilon chain n=2 Tax=Lentilactobacillus diolivorans TaxID=179838 RepID=A0A0R1SIN5_9LACO|nr:F0F1 ATP synthase subunit epsilon [Lentilactobacillus diolivorans]RRG04468.1 MAG: F0F1 ATP synthase subunit epsilon [Lactobacillus sp.]KRL69024.1 H(+)-transporting ATPase F(1) epsilon subunit [Lentilactobacillus diolivorans DSM 14421]MCH4165673.1 F0F1 ATP synthase subunit epsilon [Lentilactobacillus diolivorans]MDH5106610.1 F0F1 ATP synthase subunit epsilon [Lentilactobacillus diolivorans]GEP22529.1 ATP synthase epsilon chain [Lentilactobacillus diolivorans]
MADNSVITVSIVTPDGKVYDHTADMIVVSTQSGQLGIMANHVPVIATLAVDETRVKYDDNEDEIAVNGGFIEFSNNVATIVADSAENQSDIDVARAQNARQRAEKLIAQARQKHDQASLDRAQIALRRAINRINTAKKM